MPNFRVELDGTCVGSIGFRLFADGQQFDIYPYEPRPEEVSWGVVATMFRQVVDGVRLALITERSETARYLIFGSPYQGRVPVYYDSQIEPLFRNVFCVLDDDHDELNADNGMIAARAAVMVAHFRELRTQLTALLGDAVVLI
jgi:hypothetical protein